MSFDPESSGLAKEALLERRDQASISNPAAADESWPSESWPNRSWPADRQLIPLQAREPAREEHAEQQLLVPSPPLHDDQHPDQDARSEDKPGPGLLRRRSLATALGLVLLIPTAAGGYLYWDYARHFETTDDSFIAARAFSVSPKVSGYLTAVPVTDNQHIVAGDVIARIDERDYRAALDQAKAQLAHDQAALEQAKTNLARFQYLVERNAIAKQQADDQGFLVQQDDATVALDRAKVDAAQLNLSNTTVTAAQSGRVVNLTAAVGQFAQAGTALTNFVPDQTWVTANFKETQLDAMRPGQAVTLTIGAYPDRVIRGHVDSVQSGSGPAFSLLPPENATGNWVKIVQRVPVKIVMDNPPADVALGPGMSVDASVRVNPNPSLYERLRGWL